MREPGAILLVSCYELGHQPLAVAWAAAFLGARGYAPAVMDVSVEPFDPEQGGARPARRRVRADAHGAPGRHRADRARPRGEPRVPRRGLRALRAAERRVPLRPRRRLRDRRRGRGVAGGARRDARDRDGPAAPGWDGRAPRGAEPRAAELPGAEPRGAPLPQAVRAARARRAARAGGVRGGQPRLQAPLPALPRSRRSTAGASSSCRRTWSWPTSASASRPGRPT